MVAVFTKCGKTGFTYCSNFLIKMVGQRKTFLDLETEVREFLGLNKVLMQYKEGYLRVKWILNNYRTSSMQV